MEMHMGFFIGKVLSNQQLQSELEMEINEEFGDMKSITQQLCWIMD